jgi:uncharacterized protein
MKPFAIGVTKLLRDSSEPLHFELEGRIKDAFVSFSKVPEGEHVTITGVVEPVHQGLLVTATIKTTWQGSCVRCLEQAEGPIEVDVVELFEEEGQGEEDTYHLSGDILDLSELVKDFVVLELPVVPLCSKSCKGLCVNCGQNLNEEACSCSKDEIDPRWGKLSSL